MLPWSNIYYQRFKSLQEKFWEKVDKKGEDDCWEWLGNTRSTGGYGFLRYKEKHTRAHRISWMLSHSAEIPKGMLICHHCDTPSCVNPRHLYLGDQSSNMQDMWDRKRHPTENMGRPSETMLGSKNVTAILSEEEVLHIRRLYEGGTAQIDLGKQFGVQTPAIWKIIHRLTWKHI